MARSTFSRRSLFGGAAVAVAGGVAGYLVGRNSNAAQSSGTAASANTYGAGGSGSPSGGGSQGYLAPVARIPANGGVILPGPKVVLVKDAQGEVHGLSAVCTHLGCTVGSINHGVITCPCHGSRFNAQTGAVIQGPASRPLPAVPVTVRGGAVYES